VVLLAAGTLFGAVSERLSLISSQPVQVLVSAQLPTGHELVVGTPHLFAFIFGHNLLVGLLMVVLAPATLGVIGGLMLLTNGFVIGYLGAVFFGFSRLDYFACGILPHGIIELGALVLAYAFALRVGASMVRPSPEGWLAGMRLAVGDYARGAVVFVPLFAIAAFIESYVTPLVLRGC
jgi:stage II sporulation protein M